METRGIPCSVYRDQHGTFQRNDEHWSVAEQLAGRQMPTQLGRRWRNWASCPSPRVRHRPKAASSVCGDLSGPADQRITAGWRGDGGAANAVLAGYLVDHNERFSQPAAPFGGYLIATGGSDGN